ncbi:PLC-like phosphodiesterase [Hypoxylon trugodes]|uniref:PLC-like phosphodiesterase n=1 Tax=Hypoxylon trugodes TaxID=326681 RepID=UPI002198BDFC|nr:PLC-like phosphodiesterase [Hypoxylon trugodes]KAI1393401.1 PLC-like phosphodiesterase [Hypoxylon trugodes]
MHGVRGFIRSLAITIAVIAAPAVAESSTTAAVSLSQLALEKVLQDGREVFGDIHVSSTNGSSYADWMSEIPDETLLAHLSIPGIHDAATWNYSQDTQDSLKFATRCDGVEQKEAMVYRCQRSGIAEALDAGVRFFDLRVAAGTSGEDVVFWHSAALVSARATITDVLFGFYDWLSRHPSEALLLSFQYEGGTQANATFDAAAQGLLVDALTSDAAKLFIRQNSGVLGTLGESRGKIVLLRRFDLDGEDEGKGVKLPGLHFSPSKWPDNDPEGFELAYNEQTNATAYVEDYYEPDALGETSSVSDNVGAKVDAVKKHLKQAATSYSTNSSASNSGARRDSLFITFTSAEHNTNDPPVYPQTMALGNGTDITPDGGVNHQLVSLLGGELKGSRLGVVVVDFFDEPAELVGLILGSQPTL